jgi:putative oxidoreductase
VDNINLGLLLLRLCLGLFLAYHGYNKFFGGGRIPGTTRWFASMGMKWPRAQALLAACTEIGAGVMFAAGFLTPLAAAGIIGVMVVAIVTEHWKVGFFIFKPGQGWEYCAGDDRRR